MMPAVEFLQARPSCPVPLVGLHGEKVFTTGYVCLPCVWCGLCGRRKA